MMKINVKHIKKCAFCKYWYNPAGEGIIPRAPNINLWEYDEKAKRKCLLKNYEMKATSTCGKYVCKFDIL